MCGACICKDGYSGSKCEIPPGQQPQLCQDASLKKCAECFVNYRDRSIGDARDACNCTTVGSGAQTYIVKEALFK